MSPRDVPANEPFESLDLELGSTLGAWADAHASSLALDLEGPLDAPGMDPTWILRISGASLEAEVHLFYGPHVDISVFLTETSDHDVFIGGEDGITGQRLVEMLNGLEQMDRREHVPAWLRSPSGP
jgi:hypothetical protein